MIRFSLVRMKQVRSTSSCCAWRIAELGVGLGPHLVALDTWTRLNIRQVSRARADYDERATRPVVPV